MAQGEHTVAVNRKAGHEYHLLDRYEAGIELKGTEVKSIRQGKVNLSDAFVVIRKGEAFVYNMHISPYDHGTAWNHEPTRPRRLLLHKREILKLARATEQRGYTIVPTRLYFKNGYAKLEIAVAKGKALHDKREAIKRRELDRQLRDILRERR
ncbi:MAG: SsrA-binding protein [Candidatus Poribacteria bacterium]|nr:MAG: SsrA-binding protein [Candidatus Poribacteria bacterium]